MTRKAVFLDLNGTLVLPLKQDRLSDLVAIPGAIQSVARLVAAGFVCPVITVQSRIAKGYFTADEFDRWFRTLSAKWGARGAEILGPYVCPHRFAELCACKKPNTVLYEAAAGDLDIALSESFVIGDSPDDIGAANQLGARSCLVRTGWAGDLQMAAAAQPSVVVGSVVEAVDWILADASVSSASTTAACEL